MEKIQDKIRKLLRLARDKGASEGEVANALAMANKLMLQHNIDHVDVDGDEADAPVVVKGDRVNVEGKIQKWHIVCAHAVGELYRCRFVMYTHEGYFTFVGRKINVEMASETFGFVTEQVERLYKEGLKAFRSTLGSLSKETRGDFRTTFKEACAQRILQRAKEVIALRRNEIPQHKALVVIDNAVEQAQEFINAMPNIRTGRALTLRRSGFGTGAGRMAGDSIQLDKNPLKR